MSESTKKQVYRRFVEEVINKGNIDIIPELYHLDYLDHSAPPGAPHTGSVFDQVAQIPKMFRGAFPDVHFVIEDLVDEGDWVATRVTGHAHHFGRAFMGISPTGRQIVWSSLGMFRVVDDKIIEHYGQPDLLGLREQLALPVEPGSVDENRAVVTRYIYEINLQNFEAFDQYLHPDFVDNGVMFGQEAGIAGMKDAYRGFVTAFPDVWFTLEHMIAEGELVIVRGVMQGTHQGDFEGIAATGKKISWRGTRIFRVKNGKVAESWFNFDSADLLRQLVG